MSRVGKIHVYQPNKGVISDKEARRMKLGGEILCYAY
jgi:ribosomal protein S8